MIVSVSQGGSIKDFHGLKLLRSEVKNKYKSGLPVTDITATSRERPLGHPPLTMFLCVS